MMGALLLPRASSAQISPGELSRDHRSLEGPLNCRSCHAGKTKEMDRNCLSCHQDIQRLREQKRGFHARNGDAPCASCHPDHAGRDFELIAWDGGSFEKFDHAKAGWPLAGKHAKAACRDCHQPKHQSVEFMKLSKREDPAESWVGLETACASCHEDTHRGALGPECARCHGNEAWKPATAFDHAATAFALTGKHTDVECAKCHSAASLSLARDDQGRPIPLYKPLPHAECGACHRDPHENRLGAACASCHKTSGFRDLASGPFNHSLTRFALRGAHASVECAKCHDPVKAGGKRPAHDRCDTCHRDAHAGQTLLKGAPSEPAAPDCAACHDERAFRPSVFTPERHATTAYPLDGKHRAIECRACHAKNPAGVPKDSLGTAGVLMKPKFAACRDCHTEAHGKQLARRADGGACESCHRVQGWKPSLFTVEDHSRLKLALQGRHAEAECAACHGPRRKDLPALPSAEVTGKAGVLLALESAECVSCHVDPHAGRLTAAGKPEPAVCASCHGSGGFAPSTLDMVHHAALGFALEGAHAAASCLDCHAELARPRRASTLILAAMKEPLLPFGQKRTACVDCHEDVHGGQFKTRDDGGACGGCHGQESFKPAVRFDHDRGTAFALQGAHASVACAKCHIGRVDPDGVKRIVYRPVPRECESCHGGKRMEGMGVETRAGARPAQSQEGER